MDNYRDPELLDVEYSVTKLTIGPKARAQIQDLIIDNYPNSFPIYCNQLGIAPSNFYAVMNGTRQCTLEFINKLLSGIGYQVSMDTKLIVHQVDHGPDAPDVDFAALETKLPLKDEEEPDEYDCF